MVSDFLWQGYFNLRHGRPVIINDTSAQSLVLVQKAWTVRSMIEWARKGNLDGIIKNIPEEIIKGPIIETKPECYRASVSYGKTTENSGGYTERVPRFYYD